MGNNLGNKLRNDIMIEMDIAWHQMKNSSFRQFNIDNMAGYLVAYCIFFRKVSPTISHGHLLGIAKELITLGR